MPNPFRPLKKLVFQKGGIGRSISREETVERLNPILRKLYELNHAHNYVIRHVGDPELAAALEAQQVRARADVGKLAESIYSAGGNAYNGTDLEPEDVNLGDNDDEMLFRLLDEEQAFQDAVAAEFNLDPLEHQIRTQAVLTNVRTNSQARLNLLKDITKKRRRPATV